MHNSLSMDWTWQGQRLGLDEKTSQVRESIEQYVCFVVKQEGSEED